MPSRYEPGVSARSTKRPITMSFKIRCAVDGCRPVAAARSLRLTGSDLDASVSSSFISRSMTWMAVFSRVVVDMTQSNIVIGRITPPYETAAKSLVWCGVAAAQGLPAASAGRCCLAAVQGRAGIRMRVALFVTCLVDAIRPEIGFSVIKLLEAAGCEVVVPESQTCCGQPAFSIGRQRHGAHPCGKGAARVRRIRLRGHSERLVRWACTRALPRALPRPSRPEVTRRTTRGSLVRTHRLSHERAEGHERAVTVQRSTSPITTPAAGCANSASSASRASCLPWCRACA